MFRFLISFLIILSTNYAFARETCEPPIIKSEKEITKKLKNCNKGDKLLLFFDIKVRGEELILNLCNLEHTIITRDEISVIHKRKSGFTIICIYEPSSKYIN
tara:strand:+ start:809 stop:1114 length:306 start_codon:yes stop_codon:yes gene_type:complete